MKIKKVEIELSLNQEELDWLKHACSKIVDEVGEYIETKEEMDRLNFYKAFERL